MKPKAIVLLSSGLDSTVNFCAAVRKFNVVLALTFDYGQKAFQREMEKSQQICQQVQVFHKLISLPWLKEIANSSLVAIDKNVPTGHELDINDPIKCRESAQSVWVPNRNGIFLNVAAAFAESMGADFVVSGFNAEEAVTFPDNSAEFLQATDRVFYFSTQSQVKNFCFTIHMTKKEIYKLGQELDAPFELMWPCYFSGDEICGECESCLRFNRARSEAV